MKIQMEMIIVHLTVLLLVHHILSAPIPERGKRQLRIRHNPDGSISGSLSASHAMNTPGMDSAFGLSHAFNMGPKGVSFSGDQSASMNGRSPFGDKFGFSQTNALSSNSGLDGFNSGGSNSASNYFSNPLFSNSNANANAFANSMRHRTPFG